MGIISRHIKQALIHLSNNECEQALLFICISIDGTAKNKWPTYRPGERIKNFINEYESLIYQFASLGKIKIEEGLKIFFQGQSISIMIYKLIRNVLVHGEDIFEKIVIKEDYELGFERGKFIVNKGLIWGLLFSVIVDEKNKSEKIENDPIIQVFEKPIKINSLWGNLELLERLINQ